MKKTLKAIAVLSVFALIVSVFCACEISFGGEEKETETSLPTLSYTLSTTNEDPTRPSEEPSSTQATEKIEIDSLETILNNIKDYPIGTAGSSAKAYRIAYKMLNFTENSNFTISEVQQDYQNFISGLDDTDKLIYEENLAEIDYYARSIIENPENLAQHIENAEPISENGEITLSNYEALYVIISK